MSKNQTDKDGFMEAIENNEYAEFVINEDPEYILITDWESPVYAVCPDGIENPETLVEMIADEIPELEITHGYINEHNNINGDIVDLE